MIINLAHQKGGVGKSTIAANLGAELSKRTNTAILDLDYQRSVEIFNSNRKDKLKILNSLEKAIEYDGYVIIDSGGYDSNINRMALAMSDIIITPVSASMVEVHGLLMFKKILDDIEKQGFNLTPYVIINRVHPQSIRVVDELKEYIREHLGFKVFDTVLRQRVPYQKSFETGLSVIEMNPNSPASIEFRNFINEIERIKNEKK